jgi:galactokinase
MISIQVPARICFFGDHQDYLGLPVIAGSINRFIVLRAKPISRKEFRLYLPDVQSQRVIALKAMDEITSRDYLRSAMAVLKEKGFRFEQGYEIEISGTIPVNAGLSSSSALTVAWIRFLVAIQGDAISPSDAEIGHWAYQAEVEFFDSPGGLMDQYTIAQQGLLFIDTSEGKTERLKGIPCRLVIAESGIAKRTLDVLKNARIFQENALKEVKRVLPSFNIRNSHLSDYDSYSEFVSEYYQDHWYAAIYNYDITVKAKKILQGEGETIEVLGHLMNEHQNILENRIKNTPREMMLMMKAARKAGAYGTKTIGSGGGGCMVALVSDDTKDAVIQAFLDAGAKMAYEVELTYPTIV